MFIGYARVSSSVQETHLQLDALSRSGVSVVYSEKTSSVGTRPELQKVMAKLGRGDVLVVYKIDRIARSLKDLLSILDRLADAGASLRSLTEPLDTTVPIGVFMVQVLGAVAQLERSMIRERAIAGQVAARRRGVRWGGAKASFTTDEAQVIYELRKQGLTVALLSDMFGVSPCTISRVTMRRDSPHLRQFRRVPVLGDYLLDT